MLHFGLVVCSRTQHWKCNNINNQIYPGIPWYQVQARHAAYYHLLLSNKTSVVMLWMSRQSINIHTGVHAGYTLFYDTLAVVCMQAILCSQILEPYQYCNFNFSRMTVFRPSHPDFLCTEVEIITCCSHFQALWKSWLCPWYALSNFNKFMVILTFKMIKGILWYEIVGESHPLSAFFSTHADLFTEMHFYS